MKIVIAGDLVPTKTNELLFEKGDIEALLGSALKSRWESSDLRIFNLEAPVIDGGKPIVKSGPNLKIKTGCMKGIKELNPTIVTVANNHIRDFGTIGWNSTKKLLGQFGIPYIGAGDNYDEANAYKIVECEGRKVGFYACAEHEFSIVSNYGAGANAFCGYRNLMAIKTLKENADFVIVLYHGGKEHYAYPTPNQQIVCHEMIESGANLVVCQHSHCIGCKEEYQDGTIVYGQGNFIFDGSNETCWKTSLIVEVTLGEKIFINYIPIEKKGNVICELDGGRRERILNEFISRSNEILSEHAVREIYEKYLEGTAVDYLYTCAGWNKLIRGIDKYILKRRLIKGYFNVKKKTILLGMIQCETHREIIESYLRKEINIPVKK